MVLTMPYEKTLNFLSGEGRFKATIYAMNTLLIYKEIYTQEEFQELFVAWALKQQWKPSRPVGTRI